MNKVLSIEKLREMAFNYIEIPNFNGQGTITVQVQKPRIMAMAAEGKIPNPLLSVASKMAGSKGSAKTDENAFVDSSKVFALYCKACLVNPKYDDMKDIITDDQMLAIFNWAMGEVNEIEPFRKEQGNGSSDNNEQEVQGETE